MESQDAYWYERGVRDSRSGNHYPFDKRARPEAVKAYEEGFSKGT